MFRTRLVTLKTTVFLRFQTAFKCSFKSAFSVYIFNFSISTILNNLNMSKLFTYFLINVKLLYFIWNLHWEWAVFGKGPTKSTWDKSLILWLRNLQDAVDRPFQHHYEAKTIILGIDDKIYMKLNLNSLVLLTTQIILRLGGFGREWPSSEP